MLPKPVFKKILQVGIVVNDLEKAVKTYWDVFGIGPWQIYAMDKTNMHDTKLHGKTAEVAMNVALADLGGVQLELIEPLNESIYTEFLREHGEGMHHIACAVDNFADTTALMKRIGADVLLEGATNAGLGYAYLDTRETLSCITEIYDISANPEYPPPVATYP
jgi:4-hydroxyphenylpyruvate dioxygenase-like putative hemolysin